MLWIPAIMAIGVSLSLIVDMSHMQRSPAVYDPNDREKMKQCFRLLHQYNVDITDPEQIAQDIRAFADKMSQNPAMKLQVLECLQREKSFCQQSAYYNMKPFLCERVWALEKELESMRGGGVVADDLSTYIASEMWTTVDDDSTTELSGGTSQVSGIGTL